MLPTVRKRNGLSKHNSIDEFFAPIDSLFDQLWTDFFGDSNLIKWDVVKGRAYPKVDIFYNDSDIVIEAAIPFLNKEDVKIELKDNVITISGNVKKDDKISNKNFIRRELVRSSFSRSFSIDPELFKEWDSTTEDAITAKFKDGILRVTLKDILPRQRESPRVESRSIKIED